VNQTTGFDDRDNFTARPRPAGAAPERPPAAPPAQAEPAAPERKPFTVDDLYLHQKISVVDCSSAAQSAAAVVRSVDREKDSYASYIWLFSLDGKHQAQLTRGTGGDSSPRWSPDGKCLAFISTRGGGAAQVYAMEREGGEARQVGQFEQSVTDLAWAPDGRSLFVTSAVLVDPELRGERSDKPAPQRSMSAPEVAWRLPYKEDGVGYLLQREIHLFTLDIDSGQHRQITNGAFDVLAFQVAPSGQRLAYTRTRGGRFGHCSDLWVCNSDGSAQRQLTHDHAIVMQPAWSPDESHIAFTGAVEEGDAEPALWLFDLAGEEARPLGDVDVADPTSLRWTGDGKSLVFCRAHRGRHQVARIDVPGGELSVLVAGDRQIGAFGMTDKHLVFSPQHPSLASELYVAGLDGGGERQLSGLNPWWRERTPVDAEMRSFEVPDGLGGSEQIEGWLLRGRGQPAPAPLLNDMHGGPASYALLDFDTNVFWQVLCSNGWAVLALNAVGSASYGHEFCRRLAGHWGDYDLPQHEAAVRQLQQEGICDERVAISGKSYGGYLSAWATGHTELFKAAVVMAPVGNIETHYGTSDGGYYADPFYLASQPRFDRVRARELSPLQHIEKSHTPTLFLQGKDDERCPKCQSEELFVSLMRAGETPAELVLYPGEHHSFLGSGAPSCRSDAAQRIVDWINRFCGPQS
jgi:dipeptidyl aminopeptidase/acylaminoacyl peptidase